MAQKTRIFFGILLFLFQLSCSGFINDKQIIRIPILDFAYVSNNDVWLVTSGGKVFQLGNNKDITEIKFDAPINGVFFLNSNEGWVLSEDGLISATADGGKTWTKRYQFDNKTTTVARIPSQLIFSDNQTGWIVEGLGFWLTEDGGISWTQLLSDKEFSISEGGQPQVYFPVNSKIGWLGMSNGIILKTTNSGKSWENVGLPKPPYNPNLRRQPGFDVESLYCFDEKTCWAGIASRGGLFLTTKGGKVWEAVLEKQGKPNTEIKSINFATENVGWAVGEEFGDDLSKPTKNVVLKTTDGGKIWSFIDTGIDEPTFNKVKFVNEQNGWLISKKSVYRTYDGGKVWNKVFEVN